MSGDDSEYAVERRTGKNVELTLEGRFRRLRQRTRKHTPSVARTASTTPPTPPAIAIVRMWEIWEDSTAGFSEPVSVGTGTNETEVRVTEANVVKTWVPDVVVTSELVVNTVVLLLSDSSVPEAPLMPTPNALVVRAIGVISDSSTPAGVGEAIEVDTERTGALPTENPAIPGPAPVTTWL